MPWLLAAGRGVREWGWGHVESGTVLAGQYRVGKVLGNGSFGQVWSGRDLILDRDVAIKVMIEEDPDQDLLKLFEREVRVAARLRHPRIVAVYNAGLHEGKWFIVMELLHGTDLSKVIGRNRTRLSVERAVDLGIMLTDGLAAAHAAGVVHRDLKPANLFVEPADQLKICDFGIARDNNATSQRGHANSKAGTLLYAPPEWLLGRPVAAEPPADMYATGGILYEMLTGRAPFADPPSVVALMRDHIQTVPVPPRNLSPAIPAALDDLVMRLLAKDPRDRPTAADTHSALMKVRTSLEPADGALPPGAGRPVIWQPDPQKGTSPVAGASAYTPTVTIGPRITFNPDTQSLEGLPARDAVRSLVFSPDGRLLAVALAEEIRFWDTATGRAALRPLSGASVKRMTFTPDGRYLVTTVFGPHGVARWDLATGQRTESPPVTGAPEISPDGRFAVAASEAGVLLWDLTNRSAEPRTVRKRLGRRLNPGAHHEKPTFSRDGSRLAVAIETDVHVWDSSTLRETVRPMRNPRGVVRSICFSPDGRGIATVSTSNSGSGYRICVWDISGERPEAWQVDGNAALEPGPQVFFTPDSRIVAVIDHKTQTIGSERGKKQVLLWDVFARRSLGKITIVGLPSFSPDGTTLAAGWLDKVRLWDTAKLGDSPRVLAEPAAGTRGAMGEPVFSRDWRLMATVRNRYPEEPVIRLWRFRT